MQECLVVIIVKYLDGQVELALEFHVQLFHHHQRYFFVCHLPYQRMLKRMAIRTMTDIVKQYTHVKRFGLAVADLDILAFEGLHRSHHQVHSPKRMVKTRMSSSWIDIVGHAELLDAPESLKIWVLYQLVHQGAGNGDQAVDGIIDDLVLIHHCKVAD